MKRQALISTTLQLLKSGHNLIARGHKKIALALGSLSQSINAEYRLTGYKRALTKAKIPSTTPSFMKRATHDAGRKLQPVIADSGATGIRWDDEMAASYQRKYGIRDQRSRWLEVVTSNDTITQITRPPLPRLPNHYMILVRLPCGC